MSDQSFRDAWLWQAQTCGSMDAPFTAAILRCMVEDEGARKAVAPILAPYEDDSARAMLVANLPMRLLGGLHFIVLTGGAPDLAVKYAACETDGLTPLIADAARKRSQTLARFMTSPPQTNEVRRSFSLVGGFLEAARATNLPLRCLELGASAGLNMNWDLYAYDFGGGQCWGRPNARLALNGDWTGGLPPLAVFPEVLEKRACDQSPIDVRSEEGALHLQSYIWPEQKERLERIRVAIEIAKASKIFVEKADAGDWVRENGAPMDGATTIIYHSIFIQYPPVNVQESILVNGREDPRLFGGESVLV